MDVGAPSATSNLTDQVPHFSVNPLINHWDYSALKFCFTIIHSSEIPLPIANAAFQVS